jgi:hypothetical protein
VQTDWVTLSPSGAAAGKDSKAEAK